LSESLIPELDTPFLFRRQPIAIPADMRPGWRIGVLLLLLRICCRQNRSSFGRVHVLSWAVRTKRNQVDLLRVVEGSDAYDSLLVRIEPSVNRAVDLAFGDGLIRRIGGERIELTGKGTEAADWLRDIESVFSEEISFFTVVGGRVTEDFVKRLFSTAGRR